MPETCASSARTRCTGTSRRYHRLVSYRRSPSTSPLFSFFDCKKSWTLCGVKVTIESYDTCLVPNDPIGIVPVRISEMFSWRYQPAVGRVLNEAGGRNPRLANGTDGLGGDGIGVVDGGVFDEILGEDGDELASEREKVLIFDTLKEEAEMRLIFRPLPQLHFHLRFASLYFVKSLRHQYYAPSAKCKWYSIKGNFHLNWFHLTPGKVYKPNKTV